MSFLELLDSDDDGLASRAWYEVVVNSKGPLELARQRLGRLLALLSSPSRLARAMAWAAAASLAEASLIEATELKSRRQALVDLLSSRGPSVEAFTIAWEAARTLARLGLLTAEDLRPLSGVLWDMAERTSGRERERLLSIARELQRAGLIRGAGIRAKVLGEDSYIL